MKEMLSKEYKEYIEKQRMSHLGRKYKPMSKEGRDNISRAHKGVPFSEEHKRKMSEAQKGTKKPWSKGFPKGHPYRNTGRTRFKKGVVPWNKGLKGYLPVEEHDWMPKRENHWNWRGGIASSEYTEEWKVKFLDSIRERDNFICQECGIHQEELVGRIAKLDIHHIDYNKKNCNPDNLISLCRSCHMKTNNNRDYWESYFRQEDRA
jgi:hypothetical protein